VYRRSSRSPGSSARRPSFAKRTRSIDQSSPGPNVKKTLGRQRIRPCHFRCPLIRPLSSGSCSCGPLDPHSCITARTRFSSCWAFLASPAKASEPNGSRASRSKARRPRPLSGGYSNPICAIGQPYSTLSRAAIPADRMPSRWRDTGRGDVVRVLPEDHREDAARRKGEPCFGQRVTISSSIARKNHCASTSARWSSPPR
jgi:hypothetical protein